MTDDRKSRNEKLLFCSFCGKSQHEVTKLIAGPSVYICNECVDLCINILKDEKVKTFPEGEEKKLFNPSKIKTYLDEYIIGQDTAKIALSVAVCQHYKRINNPSEDI